ncbi:MAG: ABC transporter ATP-binding protein/permease [Ruminococcaceae bacterium]|nr:ABC transporter ATP-binding protein/permease [Oscillospiraceae bacterium]
MLKLENIVKEYTAGDTVVQALKGVSLSFRNNEFVSILGPSGCGKTTLLNIIGGLDQYTSGDLKINGVSTKDYNDGDWDTYRNHSIGFVFQSYNLIPHQSVLSNVELALTLSGVSKAERRQRAKAVLEQVGLGDQMYKKPNQMSGGQMQRVAIARALINDPDILLADEPTGALDTETSVQVMNVLREVAKDRLVIMVTHNPELAEVYSTRIIRLLDGFILNDSDPFDGETVTEKVSDKGKKKAMSLRTAMSLSLNNLMTKKTRTILTCFAGSIGIIGIALILAISNGIQNYIDKVQEDTLSTYPLTIMAETMDMTTLITSMESVGQDREEHELDKVYSSTMMADIMDAMISTETTKNNLSAFKEYIDSEESGMDQYVSDIKYSYGTLLTVYSGDTENGINRINPSTMMENMYSSFTSTDEALNTMTSMMTTSYASQMNLWTQLLDNQELLDSQYDVIAGHWPESWNEVVLAVDENNELVDVYLYSLGLKDQSEITEIILNTMEGEKIEAELESYTYEEIMNLDYRLVLPTDLYKYNETDGVWEDMSENESYMEVLIANAPRIKISGIVRPSEEAVASSITGVIGYTSELTEYVINAVNASEIVEQQQSDPAVDVISGLPFDDGSAEEFTDAEKAERFLQYSEELTSVDKAALYQQIASVPDQAQIEQMADAQLEGMDRKTVEAMILQTMSQQAGMDEAAISAYISTMTDEDLFAQVRQGMIQQLTEQYAQQGLEALGSMSTDEIAAMYDAQINNSDEAALAQMYDDYMPAQWSESTYEDTLKLLGVSELHAPTAISIYADSFESKDAIVDIIDGYNQKMADEGKSEYVISYTDMVGLIMSSVSTIINVISYVLIAFVSISLVVSSIMIGIITYISVLERTKEIGILRAVGASKKDISRVFNAETAIVGFTAGMIGIIVTMLLCLPINAVIYHLSGVVVKAELPVVAGAILVAISMGLTLVAGLIPSSIAAKKDPVEALRTE